MLNNNYNNLIFGKIFDEDEINLFRYRHFSRRAGYCL